MPLHLFTVVCDFDGGTYVSQVKAADPVQATHAWAALLRHEQPIPLASDQISENVGESINGSDLPVALKGLAHVWYLGGDVAGRTFTANIVRTA